MLVTSCIKLLRKRNLGVTAIKRAFHELKIDWTGSDSDKFSQAGAENVMVLGTGKSVIFSQDYDRTNVPSTKDLMRFFPQADVLLLEGFVPEVIPESSLKVIKIMCAGEAVKTEELKYPIQDIDILITESDELAKEALSAGKSAFSVHEPEQFIKHLEEHHGISS